MSKSLKLYPKMGKDDGGLKFFFDHEGNHYTIRFAGNPIMLLEFMYTKSGGENFMEIYRDAKAGKPIPKDAARMITECSKKVNEFLELFQFINDNKKSPFVIYISDFNTFKS